MSQFRIQIVRADGDSVRLYPGALGERDFLDAVAAKGVGWFRSTAHVQQAIADVFLDLKKEVEAPRV